MGSEFAYQTPGEKDARIIEKPYFSYRPLPGALYEILVNLEKGGSFGLAYRAVIRRLVFTSIAAHRANVVIHLRQAIQVVEGFLV